jgi:Lrp/AsnC family transcriptional regulator
MHLQRDGGLSQRALAEKVGLSQNACWRRVKRLMDDGILLGSTARVSARALGLDLTVFMMVKTRHHAKDWSTRFRQRVEAIPEVAEFHRIGGDWDYLLKIVTTSMAGYDSVYQRLISDFDLETVTGFFSMETILDHRPLVPRGTVA